MKSNRSSLADANLVNQTEEERIIIAQRQAKFDQEQRRK